VGREGTFAQLALSLQMLKNKSFLCLDFGAGSLKIAEFEPTETGALRLRQFGIRALGFEGSQEVARERVLIKAIQELAAERGFSARQINACAPGFHVFSKFVKLPAVDSSKVNQIIQYEAKQNVPFPLEEVAWDFQILGTGPNGELEVLLVAIKADIVEGLFRTAESTGLRVQLVDVSPAALCNAYRYNYGDLEGCTMLLDIGAKTSNVLFFEKGKVYARSINIGANAITQEFAAESKLKFNEAEQIKIAEGFVSLGGAYEEPDNPRQAQISKIARQVMTRLHIQVNQTVQFYRGQQGGSPPQRLLLAGGASIMAYTAQFFAEKLNLSVEYFNPFRNVDIDPSINLEELAGVAHAFGEVVGLGLRNVAQCPVELNLMPKSSLHRQQFNQKKPYFIATVCSVVLAVLAFGWFYNQLHSMKAESLAHIRSRVDPLRQEETRLNIELSRVNQLKSQVDVLHTWNEQRFAWADILTELRGALLETERVRSSVMGGIDNGVWIETLSTPEPVVTGAGAGPTYDEFGNEIEDYSDDVSTPETDAGFYDRLMMERYGIDPSRRAADTTTAVTTIEAVTGPPGNTNEIAFINLTCRGINLTRYNPSANAELMFELERTLQASPLFDPQETKLSGQMELVGEDAVTFSFGLTVRLQDPLKL
jgi:type IV pilus assembly protein PilM